MTWGGFILWMAIIYLIYYVLNIIYDLLFVKVSRQAEGDNVLHFSQEEEQFPVNLDTFSELKDTDFEPAKLEELTLNNNSIAQEKKSNEYEENNNLEHKEQYAQVESTGGVSIKNLFNVYQGKAAINTDSILWN